MADFRMPAYGIDAAEYKRLMKTRNRPLTDEPIKRRSEANVTHTPKPTTLDLYVKAEDTE